MSSPNKMSNFFRRLPAQAHSHQALPQPNARPRPQHNPDLRDPNRLAAHLPPLQTQPPHHSRLPPQQQQQQQG